MLSTRIFGLACAFANCVVPSAVVPSVSAAAPAIRLRRDIAVIDPSLSLSLFGRDASGAIYCVRSK